MAEGRMSFAGAAHDPPASGDVRPDPSIRPLSFRDLNGWEADDHKAALAVFRITSRDIENPSWQPLCAAAERAEDARGFFEAFFRPVLMDGEHTALFTGYFEPELKGSLQPTPRYRHPVYRRPPELSLPWYTRREIEETGILEGRGLEIAWVEDALDHFFLQVQGSGRIVLQDGGVIRVGYDGRNGHPYRSIGQELVRRGVFEPQEVSAQAIRTWVEQNGDDGRELLYQNPSYIFFRVSEVADPETGPLGSMNRPVTPMRSIAVDPRFTPLGAPVWIETGGRTSLRRLMVAQDTGGAILGAQRADIFCGFGEAAGELAGRLRDPGRIIVLLPADLAETGA